MRYWILCAFCLTLFSQMGMAQIVQPEENKVEDLLQNVLEDTELEIDFTDLFDMLELYKSKPLNLNKAQANDLKNLILLSDIQIRALLRHREHFGKLLSIYELQAIPHWDLNTIYTILPYITVADGKLYEPITLKNMAKKGRHDLIMRSRAILQPMPGFSQERRNSGLTAYEGDPTNLFLRYRYIFDNRISFGLTAEKDAGEAFFRGSQKQGFDFYSGHIAISDIGIFEQIVVGDYHLQFGQGLTTWTGVAFGKTPFVMNIKRQGTGLRPYTSVNEFLFLRGAAATIKLNKKLKLTTYFSHKRLSGNALTETAEQDSLIFEEEIISSIYENGFHRTQREVANKNLLGQTIYGGNLQYTKKGLNIGVTAQHTTFDKPIRNNRFLYQEFNFTGTDLTNISFDYSYTYKNTLFFGEIAKSNPGGIAAVNGALIYLDKSLSVAMLHRHLQPNYHTFYGNAWGETRNANNEQGFYFGINYAPVRKWAVSAYADQFRFNWLRFGVDAPSGGVDYLGEIRYMPTRSSSYYVRYRYRTRERNMPNNTTPLDFLIGTERDFLRFNAAYKLSDQFSCQSRVEWSSYLDQMPGNAVERGFVIFQDINYKHPKGKLTVNTRIALFDTDTYNARIYAYESDVLYFFSVPPYFGKGTRIYVNTKYRIKKGLDLWFRYAQTTFNDRNVISSGLNQIDGNLRSDYRLQLRYQF